jgi:CBS domain-containing protein
MRDKINAALGRGQQPRARDIMVKRLITLDEDMDVYRAIDLLLHNRISGAPVVGKRYELIGILSEKDCIGALTRSLVERLPFTRVADAMTREVYTLSEDDDLLSIAHVFTSKPFRRLPVVRGDTLVGQISRRDLLRTMAALLRAHPDYHAASLYLSALSPNQLRL